MKDIIRFCLVLGLITTIAGFFLGLVYSYTKDKIASQEKEKTLGAVKTVLEGMEVEEATAKDKSGNEIQYWKGKVNGEVKGFAFVVHKYGYSSDVKGIVGVNKDGEIVGFEITFQLETPALGTRAAEVPSNDYIWGIFSKKKGEKHVIKPWFQEQFIGLTINKPIIVVKGTEWLIMGPQEREMLKESNDISAISGATITSKAVADSMNDVRDQMLDLIKADSSNSNNMSEKM